MRTTRELVEARLIFVRNELLEVLKRLDPSMTTWAPAEGMRTIGGQIFEIAASELQVVLVLKEGRFISDEDVSERVGGKEDLPRLLDFLDKVRQETLTYLQGLSDEDLDVEITLPGWHEAIGLPSVPRSEVFRGIAQHEGYHTGQLVSYLWARGDNPYKWD